MRYQGGKTRLGKHIASVINQYTVSRAYWEPFVGAGGVLFHVKAPRRYASDVHCELIDMYVAMQNGWRPPPRVSEEMYARAKRGELPSHLTAFIGYGCSFGGKWFGGYARDRRGTRDLTAESSRLISRRADSFGDVRFFCCDFTKCEPPESGLVIYCDPPYEGTLKHRGNFDHAAFWERVRFLSKSGHTVFVSEYAAPDDFDVVWQQQRRMGFQNSNKRKNVVTEKLYVYNGG